MSFSWLTEAMYWLGWAAMLALLALAVYVAWKAWFSDRAGGRRRCPKCWYDMAYSEGMTCSECGYTAQRESEFGRTRRHWLRGMLAVLLAVAVVIFIRERTVQTSWAGVLPSRVLVWTLPMFSDGQNDAVLELAQRLNRGSLGEENLARLVARCAKGDGGARPGTEPWARKYGDILERFRPALAARRGGSDIDELEDRLLDLPPLITVESREHWPVGSRARVGVQIRNWWPYGSDARVRVTPLLEGGETKTIFYRGVNPPTTAYSLLTPPLTHDIGEIPVEVEVARRTVEVSDDWQPVVTRRLSVPVTVEGDVTALLEAVEGAELDEAVKSAFLGAYKWIGGTRPLRFYVSPRRTATAAFDDTAIGFVSEIIHDGEVVLSSHTWWMGGQNRDDIGFGSWSEDPDLTSLMGMDLTAGDWAVHIKSDPELAVRAGEASKYWKGEFTTPLPVEHRPRFAPEPHWWMDADEISGEESTDGDDEAEEASGNPEQP